jgi:hypothetical protein
MNQNVRGLQMTARRISWCEKCTASRISVTHLYVLIIVVFSHDLYEARETDQPTRANSSENTVAYLDDNGLLVGRDGLFRNGLDDLGHHHGQSLFCLWTYILSNRFLHFAFRTRLTFAGAVKDDHSTTCDHIKHQHLMLYIHIIMSCSLLTPLDTIDTFKP